MTDEQQEIRKWDDLGILLADEWKHRTPSGLLQAARNAHLPEGALEAWHNQLDGERTSTYVHGLSCHLSNSLLKAGSPDYDPEGYLVVAEGQPFLFDYISADGSYHSIPGKKLAHRIAMYMGGAPLRPSSQEEPISPSNQGTLALHFIADSLRRREIPALPRLKVDYLTRSVIKIGLQGIDD